MDLKVEILQQKDGHKILLYHYYSVNTPKASIILLHGMAEHHKRYEAFAVFLSENGIDVYLYDHRGHGRETQLKALGYFHDKKGYEKIVEDAIEIIKYVSKKNRSNQLYLMGHSMGSLILRNVIQQYDTVQGIILCGTTNPSLLKIKPGLFLARLIKLFYGPKHPSPLLNNLIFGSRAYTRLIKRTSFDWLSRDNKAVGAYINDPYCGFTCTSSFYYDLLKLTETAVNRILMKKTRNNLPILIISGEEDPVGGYGKEVKHLASLYEKWGYSNVTLILYPDYRHELLQELDSRKVMEDILSFILSQK